MGEIATKDVDGLVSRNHWLADRCKLLRKVWRRNYELRQYHQLRIHQLEEECETLRYMLEQREAGLMGD